MINETLRVGESFDILIKRLKIGGRKATFYCLDGFVKDEMFEKELEYLSKLTKENLDDIHRFYCASVARKAMPSCGEYLNSGWSEKMTGPGLL